MADWLDTLLEIETRYFAGMASVEKREYAWFLTNTELRDYRNANHALRLRDDGRGPEVVAREVVAFYRSRDLSPTADVDEIAEQQEIGAALRRLGVTPVRDDVLLMVYTHPDPPALPASPNPPTPFPIHAVTRHSGKGERQTLYTTAISPFPVSAANEVGKGVGGLGQETQEWIDLVASEEAGTEYEDFWREIMTREAQAEGRILYLARLDGLPVGACQLFIANEWGRIDDVFVRLGFRRRGVASALIARVVADSLTMGCRETYLFTEAGGMAEPLYRKLGFEVRAVNALRRHIAS